MKFFIDSNIIIETFKENYNKEAKDILITVLNNVLQNKLEAFINEIVESEVIYQLIFKAKSGMKLEELKLVLKAFISLEIGENIRNLFFEVIEKYDLKPNDALILATCKYYGISYLLSLDEDFKEACEKEGIVLIDSIEKLKKILNKNL